MFEVAAAALFECLAFDLLSHVQDFLPTPEVDVGGREVVEALMVASMIVMVDEVGDGPFEMTREMIILQQDPALQ